jgi:hypothetical protein
LECSVFARFAPNGCGITPLPRKVITPAVSSALAESNTYNLFIDGFILDSTRNLGQENETQSPFSVRFPQWNVKF